MVDGLSDAEYRFFMERVMEGIDPREPDFPRFREQRQRHIAWTGDTGIERTAVHEAGHAVVAHFLGWTVNELFVANDRGHVQSNLPYDAGESIGAEVERLKQWVRQRLAGVVAEEIRWRMAREPEGDVLGLTVLRYHGLLGAAATPESRNALAQAFGDLPLGGTVYDVGRSILRREAEEVRTILRTQWGRVGLIADELTRMAHRTPDGTARMSGEAFRSLIA